MTREQHELIDWAEQRIEEHTAKLIASEEGGDRLRGRIAALNDVIEHLKQPQLDPAKRIPEPSYGFGIGDDTPYT